MFSHTALFDLCNEETAISQAPEQKHLSKSYQPQRHPTTQHRCPGKITQVCYLWCTWLSPSFQWLVSQDNRLGLVVQHTVPRSDSPFLSRHGNAGYWCSMCGHKTDNKLYISCSETDFVHSIHSLEACHHYNCYDTGRPCNGTVISRHD